MASRTIPKILALYIVAPPKDSVPPERRYFFPLGKAIDEGGEIGLILPPG